MEIIDLQWLTNLRVLVLLLLLSASAVGQNLTPAFQIIEAAVADGSIPGAALLVTRHGKLVDQRAFGVCEYEARRPFQTDTICWIASLTKPITAVAAMKLVDQKKLRLDAPIEEYLPQLSGLATQDGKFHKVTVRQLLSHTSGIPASVPLRQPNFFTQSWLERELTEVVDAIPLRPLEFPPGSQVNYSNAAPYVVGRVIEVCSGQSYGEFVRSEILLPLKMSDTGFSVTKANIGRAAIVYRRDKGELAEFCRYDPGWRVNMTMPDGGLFSTPQDIARFANSFLEDRSPLLTEESSKAMLSPQSQGYGLGWILDRENQFSHWGSSGTLVWADKKTGIVGVFFAQILDYNLLARLRNRVRDAVDAAFMKS